MRWTGQTCRRFFTYKVSDGRNRAARMAQVERVAGRDPEGRTAPRSFNLGHPRGPWDLVDYPDRNMLG